MRVANARSKKRMVWQVVAERAALELAELELLEPIREALEGVWSDSVSSSAQNGSGPAASRSTHLAEEVAVVEAPAEDLTPREGVVEQVAAEAVGRVRQAAVPEAPSKATAETVA